LIHLTTGKPAAPKYHPVDSRNEFIPSMRVNIQARILHLEYEQGTA
jgi:hypothetical protein